jgi:RND family efflux transporter MFP subunit
VGDMVTPETVMYEVADLSQVWLDMTIYPQDIEEVQIGQPLTFTTDSVPGKVFSGQVDYVQPSAQSGNATYVARAYLQNPGALLKPGIYGQVRIDRQLTENRLVVPEAAVQRYGRETFVFTPEGNNRFHKHTVILGEKVADGFVLRQGLSANAQVVGNGSFVLKAELLKTQFAESD